MTSARASDDADRLILAIDTASATGGVALVRGSAVLGEETWQAGGKQTVQVLPAAERLWVRAGARPADLQAIAVSAGPGSYTGLRVGFSLAKGFALALDIPVVAVPTLEAVAYQHREAGVALWAVIDAGRGQWYVGAFRRQGSGVVAAGEPAVVTPGGLADVLAALTDDAFVGGELYPALIETLRGANPRVRFASPAAALRRPAYLAELAQANLAAGKAPDAAGLQPIYLRNST